MNTYIFTIPECESLAGKLSARSGLPVGKVLYHTFPDGETGVRLETPVEGCTAVIVATLDRPNGKILPLYFLASTLRDAGAKRIVLVAPYLAYMRQDAAFHTGEAITSRQFSGLLQGMVDMLITVDPHLHRYSSLDEIYDIPTSVVHAAPLIAAWIRSNVVNPVLIGPDEESRQWVRCVADAADAPYYVLSKQRVADDKVMVYLPEISTADMHRTPVLVDDIISTARTMMSAVRLLAACGMEIPICIGVHAVFTGTSFQDLSHMDVKHIVTTDTIEHPSNGIDIVDGLSREILAAVGIRK